MILTLSASLFCLLALSAAAEVAPPFTLEEKEAIATLPIVPTPWNETVPFACHDNDDNNNNDNNRVYPAEEKMRWPNNQVPYTIDTSFSTDDRVKIGQAMRHIEDRSCVKFIDRTEEKDYLNIGSGESGCFAKLGFRKGLGQHGMNLNRPGCLHVWIIVHELLHILGSNHEMTRPDRDDFVAIQWANIRDKSTHNFWKNRDVDNNNDDNIPTCINGNGPFDNCVSGYYGEVTMAGLPYDYKSVMHYHAFNSFAIDPKLPTIKFRDPATQTLMDSFGNTVGMTELDEKKLKAVYHC